MRVAKVLEADPGELGPCEHLDPSPGEAERLQRLTYAEARASKETYLGRLRHLEFEVKSGRLVDWERVHSAVFNIARIERDAWMNWPARVAPLIAANLQIDQVALAVGSGLFVSELLGVVRRRNPLVIWCVFRSQRTRPTCRPDDMSPGRPRTAPSTQRAERTIGSLGLAVQLFIVLLGLALSRLLLLG
jgi:hypothetical protein